MPKIPKELTAIEVARLREEGTHAVGGVPGLHLQVIGGSRAWVLRVMMGQQRRRMGLGSYPGVTLAQARDKAREAHALIDQGIDPINQRKTLQRRAVEAQAKALTFIQAREKFLAAREAEWSNAKHRQQWENTLAKYADPVIGALDVSEIEQDHLLRILEPIWTKKTETATRVRGRIEQILDWASVRGHRRGDNPARWAGHLDKLLSKPSKIAQVVHHAAVPVDRAPGVVAVIASANGMAARALLFQLLTAARSGEVRGARWDELDLDKAVWNVPANRMKGRKPHRVSLSTQAMALLREHPQVDDSPLLFPSMRLRPLSDMALLQVMRRLEIDAVPHGFRSTFRDWAAEHTSFPRDLVEMALAHTIESKVEAAYRRGDMLARRVELMQAWADYCMPAAGQS